MATLDNNLELPVTNNDIDGDPTPNNIGPASAHVILLGTIISNNPRTVFPIFNNTDSTESMFINMLIDAADIINDTTVPITLSGVIEVVYTILGDD